MGAFRRDSAADALREAMQSPETLSPIVASATKAPLRTIRIPPSGFAASYAHRPTEPAPIGLVLVAEETMARAQAMALQEAWETHPQPEERELRVDAFNAALMVNMLCRACVSPHDSTKLYFPDAPEIQFRSALTVESVRRLWEAYGRMATEESPLSREASDDQVKALCEAFGAGLLERADAPTARRVRRLLGELHGELLAP